MSDLGNREIFSKNLQYYMNLYNKTRIQVAKDIGVSYTTFTSWIKGTNYPRIDKIELLANYFRVNKADLIENKYSENKQYYNDPSVSEYAQAIKDNPDLRIFIWFYSKQKEPYRVFVPWLVIAILFNIFLIHYKPNYLLSIGITSSISTWVTSLLMFFYFKWINR